MTDAQTFSLASAAPLLGWLALLLAPLRRGSAVAFARLVAIVLAVLYTVLIGATLLFPTARGGGAPDFSSLTGLARAFANPHVMLIGWVHYLAFDLWVGAWEVEEGGERGIPHWATVPCLVLTFLAGPVGLVLFLIARAGLSGRAGGKVRRRA